MIIGVGSVSAADKFKKVTSSSEIAEGNQYIVVCQTSTSAYAMKVYSSGTYCAHQEVTITNNIVEYADGINVLTIEAGDDGWYFKQTSDNKYLYSPAAKSLKADETNKTLCTISNDFQIVMGSSNGTLQYNASSPRFCPYTSNQTSAYLYIKQEASELKSITLDITNATTTFHQNETFTHDGVIVTATYENGNTEDVTNSASFSTPDMTTTGTKDVTVSYTENDVTKTATYQIQVNVPANLTGISLSGDYQTIFTVGDTFNHDGVIVTASYDDESSKVVTSETVFSIPDMTTAGTKTITVTYSENNISKTASYDITVNAYVQPTTISFSLNNAFFGTSYTGADAKGSGPHTGTADNVTVTFSSGGEKKNFYISDSEIRAYSGNTLEFEAPTGYVITQIQFTNAWATSTTTTPTGLSTDRKSWSSSTGSETVAFTPTSRSDVTGVTVTIAPSVTVTSAGWATFAPVQDVQFDNDVMSTYIVTGSTTTSATLSAVSAVPAGTPVLVCAEEGTHALPVAGTTPAAVSGNLLQVSDGTVSGDGSTIYALGVQSNDEVGFMLVASGVEIPEGKCFLVIPAGARAFLSLGNNGETAITTVAADANDGVIYDLQGRRVNGVKQGLYIVNGKKVVLK